MRPEERYATAAEMRDALDQYLWSTGGAPRPREMSEAILQEFDAERQRTRGLIEAALQRLHSNVGGELETLALPEPHEESHRGSSRSSRKLMMGDTSLTGSQRMRTEASVVRRLPGEPSLAGRMPPLTADMLAPIVMEPSDAVALLKRKTWIVGSVLGVVFVGTTLGVALHRSPAPESAAAVAAVAASVPAPASRGVNELPTPSAPPTATMETIVFSVSVSPSTAQVLIDGRVMPSNPFLGRFAKGPGTHRVRAVAPGYQAKERLVTFDDNVMIDLSLPANKPGTAWHHESTPARRVEPPAAPVREQPIVPVAIAPALVAAPVKSSAPAEIQPRGEWEPPRKRNIDTHNPYGEEK